MIDWRILPGALRSNLADEAFRKAASTICGQAEILTEDFEAGALVDQGSAESLRLLTAIVRAIAPRAEHAAGRA